MRDNCIAIVGASVRAAAMSAVRAGFAPVAFDLFADVDLKAICHATRVSPYPAGLVDWVTASPADAWVYTGALENYPDIIDAIARKKRLLGNTGSVLRRIRCPLLLHDALSAAGLPFPDTREEAIGLPTDDTWLAKSYRGSSGSGVLAYHGQLAVRSEHTRRYFQHRIEGNPGSAVYAASGGTAQLLGITRQLVGTVWTHAKPFQYAGSVGPWEIGSVAIRQIRAIGATLAGRFDLVGLFGVDFILADDTVWTIEVNPRYTASVEIVERSAGRPALAIHAEACAGQRSQTAICPPRRYYGKAILFAERDLIVPSAFASWAISMNNDPRCPAIADIPSAGTSILRFQPVATAFAIEDTEDAVLEQLKTGCATIKAKCD